MNQKRSVFPKGNTLLFADAMMGSAQTRWGFAQDTAAAVRRNSAPRDPLRWTRAGALGKGGPKLECYITWNR